MRRIAGIRAASSALLVSVALAPVLSGSALAHTAGSLDPYGCHNDARRSRDAYHCHRGDYNGLRFRSKADMIAKKKAGVTASEIRAGESDTPVVTGAEDAPKSDPSAVASAPEGSKREDWTVFGWMTGDNPDERSAAVGTGGQVVPKGIEARLRTLQRLHEEGLITDSEYAAKRGEILGEL